MSFETISMLLNWMALGALLAILFRLSYTFDLIANTQRELRRAIHNLGDRRATELGTNHASGGPGIGLVSPFPQVRASAESTMGSRRFAPPRRCCRCSNLGSDTLLTGRGSPGAAARVDHASDAGMSEVLISAERHRRGGEAPLAPLGPHAGDGGAVRDPAAD